MSSRPRTLVGRTVWVSVASLPAFFIGRFTAPKQASPVTDPAKQARERIAELKEAEQAAFNERLNLIVKDIAKIDRIAKPSPERERLIKQGCAITKLLTTQTKVSVAFNESHCRNPAQPTTATVGAVRRNPATQQRKRPARTTVAARKPGSTKP